MENNAKWQISTKEKLYFIDALTPALPALRAKAGVPQDELSRLLGISRQTYGAIERRTRRMSWNTYLSLILFFDYNESTHDMLRSLSAFPSSLIERFNDGVQSRGVDLSQLAGANVDLMEVLDEHALHSIRTVVMVEYARCQQLPGDAVIKSFDGHSFTHPILAQDVKIKQSLKKLKGQGLTK